MAAGDRLFMDGCNHPLRAAVLYSTVHAMATTEEKRRKTRRRADELLCVARALPVVRHTPNRGRKEKKSSRSREDGGGAFF